jgi:hypothetical protein
MEELSREKEENKEIEEKEKGKKIGLLKCMIGYCLWIEWNLSTDDEEIKMFEHAVIPVCLKMLGVCEENAIPSDGMTGDACLLFLIRCAVSTSVVRIMFCCDENKELFGRILSCSLRMEEGWVRYEMIALLGILAEGEEKEMIEWVEKEGGMICSLRNIRGSGERGNFRLEWGVFFQKFVWLKELKERRKRERKEEEKKRREEMWMIEEEGGRDLVLHFRHHLNGEVVKYSNETLSVVGVHE